MSQAENVVGILELDDITGRRLIFTSARVIIMKNRGAAAGGAIGIIIMVLLIIFLGWLIGFILGFVAALVIGKLAGKPKDYSRVTVESLLSMNHEEINYPQIEKVELKKNRLKFFYVVYGGDRKKKQFAIHRSLYQQNLDLLGKVLFDKIIVK